MIHEKASTDLSKASPKSTAAFHKFLREGTSNEEKLLFPQRSSMVEEDDSDGGIEFIEALSDRGEHEHIASGRDFITTKARIFGEAI